jgi:hypothetical protein
MGPGLTQRREDAETRGESFARRGAVSDEGVKAALLGDLDHAVVAGLVPLLTFAREARTGIALSHSGAALRVKLVERVLHGNNFIFDGPHGMKFRSVDFVAVAREGFGAN